MLPSRHSSVSLLFSISIVLTVLVLISESTSASSSASPRFEHAVPVLTRPSNLFQYIHANIFQEGNSASAKQLDAFEEIEKEAKAGRITTLIFNRTELDDKARATAQVSLKGQNLIVRIMARDIPSPEYFGAARYALWVYVENYQVRLYLGDLPFSITSPSFKSSMQGKSEKKRITRGESDCSYRLKLMPADAVFGGLILSAEPASYTPVINEVFRPLLTTRPVITEDHKRNGAN